MRKVLDRHLDLQLLRFSPRCWSQLGAKPRCRSRTCNQTAQGSSLSSSSRKPCRRSIVRSQGVTVQEDVQRRTEHVETKIRIAAAECNALEQRIEGLALAHRRRELEVADVWQDVEAGMVSAQEVLKTSADLRESGQQEVTELGCLQKEACRQAVAVQVLRRWHDEAEAHHPKTRLAVLTAQLADERRRRSKEIQQEMDEISRLEDLLRNMSGAA
ncbi:unnamed protein product [Symbiodinium sp. CCMP2456]|nr:unnamed protein product [Symbiodinium sp. CCMP2456]